MPGTDAHEATAVVVGELAVPHVVELPARGLGADMIGRAAALLVDIPLDTSTTGYRVGARASTAARRARDFLARDVDALEEAWERARRERGGTVKVQAPGPWTLAASLELAGGARLLTDRGAVRDVADSLGEGLAVHAADVARRTGADVIVQWDEPLLPDVVAGRLRGRTKLETIGAVPRPEAVAMLDRVVDGCGRMSLVHCCADDIPADLVRESAASALSIDLAAVGPAAFDGLGELLESGTRLLLGAVPSTDPGGRASWHEYARRAVALGDRLGFPRTAFAARVGITPACGLAGASASWTRTALRAASDAAAAVAADPEEF
ncbi:methionine synthase [Rhodococcus sp. HNM0569]|nr:methionine synthase [Rhodococcus sp. HNM0569]